jgi:hypothetical protein
MSAPKDDIDLRRQALLKTARAAVRLKHSLAADAELNDLIPELERRFDAYVQRGELPEVARLLRDSGVLQDA